MQLNRARQIAEEIIKRIQPFCERAEIAGSIRREKAEPGDIEICAISQDRKKENGGLYFALRNLGPIVKGDVFGGKYVKVEIYVKNIYFDAPADETISLDLFFTNPDNWGYIFFIRTGSAGYVHWMASKWNYLGYQGKDGYITKHGIKIFTPDENNIFNILCMDPVDPKERNKENYL